MKQRKCPNLRKQCPECGKCFSFKSGKNYIHKHLKKVHGFKKDKPDNNFITLKYGTITYYKESDNDENKKYLKD